MGRWRVEHVGTDSSGVVRGRRPAPTHTSLRTAPFAKEGATAGVTTYNNDSKVVHGTDDQSSSSTATLEYFEYGGFESLNKIPVARLSDGVLLNLQLLFTFEWQFTIEKRLVLVIVANKRYERMLEKLAKIGKDKVLKRPRDKEKMR